MTSLSLILDIKALKTRKNWLIVHILSHALIPCLFLPGVLFNQFIFHSHESFKHLVLMWLAWSAIALFYGIKFLLIRFCAYKNFGTKFLTFSIIFNAFCLIGPIYSLISEIQPLGYALLQLFIMIYAAVKLFYDIKLRTINKKVKKYHRNQEAQALKRRRNKPLKS